MILINKVIFLALMLTTSFLVNTKALAFTPKKVAPERAERFFSPFKIPRDLGEKIAKTIKDKYRNFTTNTTKFALTPIAVGIDNGIIAKIRISFEREVEKNLYPTGRDDQFLVKDKLKINLEAGGGIVLRGLFQKVIEYNLVFPVKTNQAGIFHNKFLLDFFLYKKIKNFNLPKKSVVFIDHYFIKKGELKFAFPVSEVINFSAKISHGIVNFKRKVLNFKQKGIVHLFTDQGKYPQTTLNLNANIFFLKTEFYNRTHSNGKLSRKYFKIIYKDKCDSSCMLKLKNFIHSNKFKQNNVFNVQDIFGSKFKSYDYNTSFFGIFKNSGNERFEQITTPELKYSIVENDHIYTWNTFFNGEKFYDQIKLISEPTLITQNPYQLQNARAEIALNIDDYIITRNELENYYVPMINKITLDSTFINDPPNFEKEKGFSSRGFVQMKINLDNDALNKLINLSKKEYWQSVLLLTSFDRKTWYNISRSKLDLNYLKKYPKANHYPKILKKSAKRFFKFFHYLTESHKSANINKKLKKLKMALSMSIYRGKHIFVPDILALINYITTSEHFYFTVEMIRFALPNNDENQFDRVLTLNYGDRPLEDKRSGSQVYTVNDYFHNYDKLD